MLGTRPLQSGDPRVHELQSLPAEDVEGPPQSRPDAGCKLLHSTSEPYINPTTRGQLGEGALISLSNLVAGPLRAWTLPQSSLPFAEAYHGNVEVQRRVPANLMD